jgi:glycine/D-amino acid oxidase-like deaminating enzyme
LAGACLSETDPLKSGPLLLRDLRAIFPELETIRISHSWMGFVAYTFNTLPHMGVHDGVHYAMGYCGTGVSLASYCGMKTARRPAGSRMPKPGWNTSRFRHAPFYSGNPWFLSASVAWYRFVDSLNI